MPALAGASPPSPENLVGAECLLRGKTREDELLGQLRKTPGAWSLYTYRRDSPSRVFPPRAFLKKGGTGGGDFKGQPEAERSELT